jgi:hypothetical protein
MPTFRKKWSGSWMKQWFYVKNDLSLRNDVKDVIHWTIRSSFGSKRPTIVNIEKFQACLAAFNVVQLHRHKRPSARAHNFQGMAPSNRKWEMPKDARADTSQNARKSSLVHLKYSYRYKNQFGEPDDDWLDAIEATSDELLGAYTKAEDEAMNSAFGA